MLNLQERSGYADGYGKGKYVCSQNKEWWVGDCFLTNGGGVVGAEGKRKN